MTNQTLRIQSLRNAEARGEIRLAVIDIAGIENGRDAWEATKTVLQLATDGHFSAEDRNFYVLQIEMKRIEVELDARLGAIEDRLAALEKPRPS
jgi:hypothetical protein